MKKTIYYHDTDAGGVVYYANYLRYMEEARIDFFHEKGIREDSIAGTAVFFPVRHCAITYTKPACYGDTISCNAEIKKTSPARIIFLQKVINTLTKETLAEAEITLACVNAENFRPIRIPEEILEQLCRD